MAQIIRYMEEMKNTPPFEYAGGRIPNDAGPKDSIKIKDKAVVARAANSKVIGEVMTWAWSTPRGKPVFNFVSEGRDFSSSDRVVIPATGFYEYTAPQNPKVKLKDRHLFTMRKSEWFWIAGIVKNECFATLTTAPGPDIEPYHDRQIVTLAPSDAMDWLSLTGQKKVVLSPPPKGTFSIKTLRRDGKLLG